MNQRVNIQYTIEMSELSTETNRLLEQSYTRLREISEALNTPDEVLSLRTLKQLDELRQELAKVDYRLSDISNIISGYLKFSASPEEGPSTPNLQDPSVLLPPLEEKLQEFRRSVARPDENSD